MNDAKALALLKSGDQEALEWFIDKYSAYVGTVVNSILASSMTHEDVEEVTADVFVTLWRSAENLYPLNLKGYLSRVARSLSMQKLRERVQREDQDQLIRKLVYSMPQPDKEIFLRFYYYCQSVSVIANQMQMNPSTIKTKLRRGRERLRTFLSDLRNTKGGDLNANQHS